MKIADFEARQDVMAQYADALDRLLEERPSRPCAGCTLQCPQCGSRACVCRCHAGCPEAPRMLSSDPERFPIESGILPLVYALRATGVCAPNWSCEGHLGRDSRLWKLPRVWFYVRHAVVADLIAHVLQRLRIKKRLAHDWRVVLVPRDNDVDTTFAVEPALDGREPDMKPDMEGAQLTQLRNDVRSIAENMPAGIADLAKARRDGMR